MEGDVFPKTYIVHVSHFNPLPPHGGRPICNGIWCGFIVISIHSLRMEGDAARLGPFARYGIISIHSLRMEGDLTGVMIFVPESHFNPLPPHGGRPFAIFIYVIIFKLFQSTPSAWRETIIGKCRNTSVIISIHSLRMEGDTFFSDCVPK